MGIVTVIDSDFMHNQAQRGGAVSIRGGSATFDACGFKHNNASEAGGAIDVQAGQAIFREQSWLRHNMAAGKSESLNVRHDGSISFFLPVLLGSWIESGHEDHAVLRERSETDYPYECPAGLWGGSPENYHQSSSLCAAANRRSHPEPAITKYRPH